PLMNMIDRRREETAKSIEDARIAEEARQNAENDASIIIEDAQKKANVIIREANERADASAKDVINQAQEGISKEREQALQDVEKGRTRIFSEMQDQMIGLAIAGAEKIIDEKIDEKKQRELLSSFFTNLKSMDFTFPEDRSFAGETVQITSAVSLSDDEKNKLMELIVKKLKDEDIKFDFRIDSDLLGGLVISVGDVLLDDSVRGKLHNLRQKLR
ncbi:MAG: F0F1 ATP synthase subunit B, partial [Chloroflexota bacterium]